MTHLTPSRAAIQRAAYEFIASEVGDDLPGMTDQAERFVDHLIASGAVIDATTLADNEALISDLESRAAWRGEHDYGSADALEALATVLIEQGAIR